MVDIKTFACMLSMVVVIGNGKEILFYFTSKYGVR